MRKRLRSILFAPILLLGLVTIHRNAAAQSVDFTFNGICVDSPTNFIGTSSGITPVTWAWDFGDGFFGNTQNVSHTYAGVNVVPGYSVTLTVTDNLGAVYTQNKFVSIQDLPFVFFSYNTPACSSDSVYFHNLSNTTYGWNERYVWDYGDGSPNDTIYFDDNPDVAHLFPAFGTFNVTLQVMNSDSCVNQTTQVVTIIPSPTANFFFAGRCEDQIVQFTDASFAGGPGNVVAWEWDFGDPTSGINNTSNLTDPTHDFQLPGIYRVTHKVINFNNCWDTISKLVVINPHPPVDFIYTAACLNQLVYFDPDTNVTNVNSIGNWFWDFGDGQTALGPNVAHQYNTPGTYTVTLTVTDTLGCMNVVTHSLLVNPLPVAHFDAGLSNCAGETVDFTDASSTTAGFIVRWEWDFGDGNTLVVNWPSNPNIQHVYALAGTYQVDLLVTASDSCTDTETQFIDIFPTPVANFSFNTPVCFGTAVDFTDISQLNGAGSIVQWQWNFGDPASGILNTSTVPDPSHLFTLIGSFTVELVVTTGNGCSDTITYPVVVKPQPPVNFTTTNNCQNNAVEFDPDLLVMNVATIADWFWEFGDGGTSVQQNATHVYVAPGMYMVTLTVTDTAGCTNSITKPVAIVAQPTANFSYSQPACRLSAIQFTDQSLAPVGYIVRWEWDFGDGNTQIVNFPTNPDLSHIYANYGTFNAQLTIITNDSCEQFIIVPVVVSPNPLSNFSFLTSCVGSPVQFNDLSQPGAGGITGWLWNFGDPPSGANNTALIEDPTHIFSGAGTFNVSLIVTNTGGCQDTVIKPVLVHALPIVDFSISPGCVNDSTHFISSTFVDPGAVVSWDFGDGFTSPEIDPYHSYTSSGTFVVTLTVTDTAGCINSRTQNVSIVPPPVSFFQVSDQTCANNPVFFTNLSSTPGGTITSYYWDFGDGSDTLILAPASGSVSHVYSVAGTITAELTIYTSLGCEDDYTRTFTVSASPLALFNFDNTCAGSSVSFTDLSQVNSGTSIVNWLWNFGDPGSGTSNTSNLQNPLHIYSLPGTYIVLLEVENASGCPDTLSKTIVINPSPPVDFNWSSTCQGSSTQFTINTTVTNVAAVASIDWDFGDGTAHNTSQQNPVHTYALPGVYNVILLIEDTAGCRNSVPHVVTISPKPVALFSSASACLGASTHFTDQSFTPNGEPITGWHWDFGVATLTNDTSNLQNPAWIYTTLGVYNVSLIATSQSGCQDTTTLSLQVFGNPTASFNYTANPCSNGAVIFQDSSYGQQATIVGWNWTFEAGNYSTLQNPVYVFYAPDSCYSVQLVVTDVRGCVDTIVNDSVCVPAQFNMTFASSATCLRDSTYFTPQLLTPVADSIVFFNWDFGDAASGIYNTSTQEFPSHYYSVPGTYTVSLQAFDMFNCPDIEYLTVVVHPLPVPVFAYTEGICDSTIRFDESSTGNGSPITQWIWNYGDGVIDTIVPPITPDISHKYLNSGIYVVGLTVINSNGCSNLISDSNVLVKPCINAEFTVIDTLICQNNMLSFADSSYSGISTNEWYWNFGDGTDTTYFSYTNPVNHVFETSGTFTVTLRVSTDVSGQKVSDSVQMVVFVNPTPLPDFTFGTVCYKQNAVFTNMTSGNGTKISEYRWSFGEPTSAPDDTSSLKNPNHLYNAPGTYDIQLVAENSIGCTDSIQKTLIVQGLPDANYTYALSCAGDKTAFTDLSIEAVAPLMHWTWTFNNSTGVVGRMEVQNPDFVFETPGDYLVNLLVTDTNGCIDTINQNVTTWNIPTSAYTYADNFNDVQGQLQFTNVSIDATKYYWTFGNGDDSYAENPVVFYQNDGTYDIMLVTWNDKDCSDTLVLTYEFMVKGLYIPNAFSPTNPKLEVQLLKPIGINLEEFRFEVYDRWGNILWWTDELDAYGRPTEGWDGRYNGVLMQEGVYVWKASGVFKDGTIWEADNIGNNDNLPKLKSGTATMMR